MATVALYLLLPMVAFVVLAILPRGRPALIGIAVAALAVAVLGPVVLPEDGSGYGTLLRRASGGAVAAAALAQALRMVRLPVPYPLVVALVLLVASVVTARILGVF